MQSCSLNCLPSQCVPCYLILGQMAPLDHSPLSLKDSGCRLIYFIQTGVSSGKLLLWPWAGQNLCRQCIILFWSYFSIILSGNLLPSENQFQYKVYGACHKTNGQKWEAIMTTYFPIAKLHLMYIAILVSGWSEKFLVPYISLRKQHLEVSRDRIKITNLYKCKFTAIIVYLDR